MYYFFKIVGVYTGSLFYSSQPINTYDILFIFLQVNFVGRYPFLISYIRFYSNKYLQYVHKCLR